MAHIGYVAHMRYGGIKTSAVRDGRSLRASGWRTPLLGLAAGVLAASMCLFPVAVAQAAPTSPGSVSSCDGTSPSGLSAGQSLSVPAGSDISCLKSTDGHYLLILQGDGNLVLYGMPQHFAIWSSRTQGNPGDYLIMQADGNLVLYSAAGSALWNSATWGHPGSYLAIQTDGNVVVYSPSSAAAPNVVGGEAAHTTYLGAAQALWFSGTNQPVGLGSTLVAGQSLTADTYLQSGSHNFELDMFASGAAVESNAALCPTFMFPPATYPTSGKATATDTNFVQLPALVAGSYLAMQTDGNLVLYSASNSAIWASGSNGSWPGPISLSLQNDGNLVISDGNGPIWSTNGNIYAGSLLCPGMTISGLIGSSPPNTGSSSPSNGLSLFYDMSLQPEQSAGQQNELGFSVDKSDWEFGVNGAAPGDEIATGLQPNSYAVMQTDGNLVIYPPGGGPAEWSTNTSGNPGAYAYNFAASGNGAEVMVMPSSGPGVGGGPLYPSGKGYVVPVPGLLASAYLGGSCFNCAEQGPYYTG
jgi:hypothetical protein